MTPPARKGVSVIVRTFNSADHLSACIASIRHQSVAAEVVVVDSGSSDDTLQMAEAASDALVHVSDYTPGKALNAGASHASASIHVALSSHVTLPDPDWIARCVGNFRSERVAATSGSRFDVGNRPLTGRATQTRTQLRSAPYWGYSNTAGAWRAAAWSEHPFDEHLMACEDKEWASRLLDAGWEVVIDPGLVIDDRHRRAQGWRHYTKRLSREHQSLVEAGLTQPWKLSDLLGAWLRDSGPRSRVREMISLDRNLSLLMRYIATRSIKP